ncbi:MULTISPECIES: YaiI/YqxD family protein [unclassified Bacillus (in: firmicutes)]|uniref:YaiI/YqxD family protein n=1 Tax=unclassified Bacillus (in: firmicutes) TaxID=185979 RepID=UPI000B803913|nr:MULTISPECIES: YaiI/YqxD family protein [unclassified Bacillus (in: firmicutes)]
MGIPTIFVDADSCPVKTEIVEIAKSFSVNVLFVASYAHMMNEYATATWKFVDSTKEAVDLYIMNHVKRGDIAITQDIGLASTLLPQGVYVLSPKGILYEEEKIHTALDLRYLSAKARRQGIHGKGPKPFTNSDRNRFVSELKGILSNIITA